MKKRNLVVLIFLLGLFLGYGGNEFFRSINSSKWHVGKKYGIVYEPKALLNVEIPLPEIKRFRAKVKFLQPINNSRSMRSLGYVAEVLVDNLKKGDIPEKYKERKKIGNMTILPLKEVTYAIKFDFVLKDKDGFEIVKVWSKRFFIRSGQLNKLQGIGKPNIPISIIRRVEKVEPRLIVLECETCKNSNSSNE